MGILMGIFLYLIVAAFLCAFGKFLKECDDAILKGMKNEIMNRKRFHYPAHNLF